MKQYAYIDKCGKLVYFHDGLNMLVIGCGRNGWELRFKK